MSCRHLTSNIRGEWPLHQCEIKDKNFPDNFLPIKEEFEQRFPTTVPPNNECPFAYQGLDECKNCPFYEGNN